MKKFFVLIIGVFSMLFFACGEEDVIPIPLPPTQPAADVPAPAAVEQKVELPPPAEKPEPPAKPSKPEKQAKEPPAKKEPTAKAAPAPIYWGDDSEQPTKGRYVIQVGIVPTDASAKRMIKKLAENGIKAYNAKVQNPDPDKGMIGTYNRIRVGFFDSKANAEAFAKVRLEPLGYSWWVDRSKNDYVGKLAASESEPVFEVEKIPEQAPKKMSEQERKDAEKAAAIAAAKEEYKAIAKAATAATASAAPPALPPPTIPAKAKTAAPPAPKAAAPAKTKNAATKEAEIDSRGKVKMKSKR